LKKGGVFRWPETGGCLWGGRRGPQNGPFFRRGAGPVRDIVKKKMDC